MDPDRIENTNEMADTEWDGMTLEELRLQRAITLVKLDIKKEILFKKFSSYSIIPHDSPLSILSKGNKAVSFLKYAFLGYKGMKLISKLWKWNKK